MKQKYLGLITILMVVKTLYAEEFSSRQDIIQEQARLIHQNEARLNKEQFKQRLKAPEEIKTALESKHFKTESPTQNQIYIKTLQIEGSPFFEEKWAGKLKKYEGKYYTIDGIQSIVRALSNESISEGYITTRIHLKEQKLTEGVLVLSVIEGRIEGIDYDGPQSHLWLTLPIAAGDLLNIRPLERGLNQFNRLESNQLQIELVPSMETLGETRVKLKNTVGKKSEAYLRYDTILEPTITVLPRSLDVKRENLLELNEVWNLSYYQVQKDQNKFQNSVDLGLSLPLMALTGEIGYSQYDQSQIQGTYSTKPWTTHRESLSYGLSVPLREKRTQKIVAKVGLARIFNRQMIGDVDIDETNYIKSIATFGLSQSLYRKSGVVYMGITYHKTVDTLGEQGQLKNPLFQFQKYTGNVDFYSRSWGEKIPVRWESHLFGQYTSEPLQSTDQMAMGGYYTVRGFNTIQLGDKGLISRQELKVDKQIKNMQITLTSFVDAGKLWQLSSEKSQEEMTLISGGIGLALTTKAYAIEWVTALPIGGDAQLRDKEKGRSDIKIIFFLL